jgi:hypothetical protein
MSSCNIDEPSKVPQKATCSTPISRPRACMTESHTMNVWGMLVWPGCNDMQANILHTAISSIPRLLVSPDY